MCPDLTRPATGREHAIELRILSNRRAGLNAERTCRINCMRGQLTSNLLASERSLDLGTAAPHPAERLPDPGRLRRTACKWLETWLRNGHVRVPRTSPQPPWKQPIASTSTPW